nr:proline-rich protein 12-like [Macaca fascicularis]
MGVCVPGCASVSAERWGRAVGIPPASRRGEQEAGAGRSGEPRPSRAPRRALLCTHTPSLPRSPPRPPSWIWALRRPPPLRSRTSSPFQPGLSGAPLPSPTCPARSSISPLLSVCLAAAPEEREPEPEQEPEAAEPGNAGPSAAARGRRTWDASCAHRP